MNAILTLNSFLTSFEQFKRAHIVFGRKEEDGRLCRCHNEITQLLVVSLLRICL